MKKNYKNIVLVFITSCVVLLVAASIYAYVLLNSKIDIEENDIKVQIKYGSSLSEIVQQLNDKNLLKPFYFFENVVKLYAYATNKSILAGYHKFSAEISNAELIVSLFTGENLYMQSVTFPEGITIKRFASILQRKLDIDSGQFHRLCYDKNIIKKYGIKANSLEGYLFPATFNFFKDIEPQEVIDILVKEQLKYLQDLKNEIGKSKLTQLEILTLASIIEAETPVARERERISGVYHNRLKKNMMLQADPTVQYAIGEKRRLLYSDLKVDNKYNTYKYLGLPPGPINSPSKSSIKAAINPEKNNYLFFVAKGDSSNEHLFATNYYEHQKNVAKFRKNINKKRKNKVL